MMDVDAALRRLKDHPVDPRLEGLEPAVFDGIAVRAAATPLSAPVIGCAVSLALVIGMLGAAIPGQVDHGTPITPLGAASALMPSTLLAPGE